MSECLNQRLSLASEFKDCQKAFCALGDETRQHIIIALLENQKVGMRVGEITERTYLSRPAVSHHLKILKDAEIINMHRQGTKNYYYMDVKATEWGKIFLLIDHVREIMTKVSETNYPHNKE